MFTVRRSADRGSSALSWLKSHHTFSFANYHEPKQMGFGALRVVNDDTVVAGKGFATHGHRDMEIISYVVKGALEHKDSLGTGSIIKTGEVQRMTAGTGVTHSEFNHSASEEMRFLQLWIVPDTKGLKPSYEQKYVGDKLVDRLQLIASKTGEDESLEVHQDVKLYASLSGPGIRLSHELAEGRMYWLQVIDGELDIHGTLLQPGDGLAVIDEKELRIEVVKQANFILFDLKQD